MENGLTVVLGSAGGNPAEVKMEMTGRLIDFDADPEPSVAPVVTQTQQTTVTQPVVQPMSSTNDNNWASFDFSLQTNVSQPPSNVNTLDPILSQLSVPASVPGHVSGVSSSVGRQVPAPVPNVNVAPIVGNSNVAFTGLIQTLPFGADSGVPAASQVNSFSTMPPTVALTAALGLIPMPVSSDSSQVGVNNAGQWPNMQHNQTFFPAAGVQPSTQQPVPGASANQAWNYASSRHMQPLSALVAQTPQTVLNPIQDVTSVVASQPPPSETKASGRKELPADLFTATYSTYPVVAPGWQTGPPRGMGLTMQYNNSAVPMSSFPQSSRSLNPFDLGGEAPQTQTFPSVASLQGSLPNVPLPSGLARTSSLGTPSSAWMPPQSLPHASGMPLQSMPYGSAMPQGPYLGARLPSNLPPSGHQIGGIGSEASFGFVNTAPTTPQPFSSVGGNPFG